MPQSNSEDQNLSENLPKSWVKKKAKPATSYAKKKVPGGDRDSFSEKPAKPKSSKYYSKKATSYSKGSKTQEDDIEKKDY